MAVEKDLFLENLGLLLRAQMPVSEAVLSLKQEIHSKKMLAIVSIIQEEIESGSNISNALEKSKLLSKRFVSLLKIGEETGKLSEQLSLVVAEQKKEQAFRSKIRNALIYPGFVIVVTLIVGVITVSYVFPKLTTIFDTVGGTLPITTRAIIGIGTFFRLYGALAVPLFTIIVILGFFFLFIYSKTKILGEKILFHLPVAKTIIQEIELARFGYILSTLLSAGVSLPQALDSVKDSTSFLLYKKFYAEIVERMMEGSSLYKSITSISAYGRFIPSHIARLILAGEMSGALPETLLTISSTYEEKTDNLTKNLSALLEPVIIVVVGLIVAVIALGIISPIYGLVDQLGQ